MIIGHQNKGPPLPGYKNQALEEFRATSLKLIRTKIMGMKSERKKQFIEKTGMYAVNLVANLFRGKSDNVMLSPTSHDYAISPQHTMDFHELTRKSSGFPANTFTKSFMSLSTSTGILPVLPVLAKAYEKTESTARTTSRKWLSPQSQDAPRKLFEMVRKQTANTPKEETLRSSIDFPWVKTV